MNTDPKYLTIANRLQKRIAWGIYSNKNPLPSEAALSKEFNVSRVTIRKAVQLLEEMGILQTHQGRRTRVNNSIFLNRYENIKSAKDIYENCPEALKLISYKTETIHRINPDDAAFLETTAYESIFCIHRVMGYDGKPYCYLKNYIPYHIAPDLNQVIDQYYKKSKIVDLYIILQNEYDIFYKGAAETIFVRAADNEQASALSVPIGTSLICSRREAFCQKAPMECSYTANIAENYRLVLTMKRDYV